MPKKSKKKSKTSYDVLNKKVWPDKKNTSNRYNEWKKANLSLVESLFCARNWERESERKKAVDEMIASVNKVKKNSEAD